MYVYIYSYIYNIYIYIIHIIYIYIYIIYTYTWDYTNLYPGGHQQNRYGHLMGIRRYGAGNAVGPYGHPSDV